MSCLSCSSHASAPSIPLRGGDKTSAQQPPSPSSSLRCLSRAPACSGLRRNRARRKRRASKLIHPRRHNCEQRPLAPHLLAPAQRAARVDGEGKLPKVLRQQLQHRTKRRLWLQRSRDACPSCVEAARTNRTSCTMRDARALRRAAQASSPPSQLTQASSRQASSLQASSAPGQLTPKRVHPQASSRVSLRGGSYPHQNPGKVDFGFGLLANPDGFRHIEHVAALI